jgi:hypothetical protein
MTCKNTAQQKAIKGPTHTKPANSDNPLAKQEKKELEKIVHVHENFWSKLNK